MHALILSVVLPLLPTQAAPPADAPQKSRVQHVDFAETDVINGSVDGPADSLVTITKRPVFGPLLEVRANFNDKLLQSASEM